MLVQYVFCDLCIEMTLMPFAYNLETVPFVFPLAIYVFTMNVVSRLSALTSLFPPKITFIEHNKLYGKLTIEEQKNFYHIRDMQNQTN